MNFTVEEKIVALKREVSLRQKVYPNRVATRRMSSKVAHREIEIMRSILDDYEKQAIDSDLFKGS